MRFPEGGEDNDQFRIIEPRAHPCTDTHVRANWRMKFNVALFGELIILYLTSFGKKFEESLTIGKTFLIICEAGISSSSYGSADA